MPHPPRALLLLILAILTGCKLGRGSQNLSYTSFMESRYGAPSQDSASWTDSVGTLSEACVRSEIGVHEQPHLLLAVCSKPSEASHPTEGLVDLYVLRGSWDDFVVAAETTGIGSGSNGNPGDVRALRLGANFYGFEIRGGYLGQGQYVENTSWYAPSRSNGIHLVYQATSLDDGRETLECAEDSLACAMESRLASIDSSRIDLRTFPVQLVDTLLRRGTTRQRSTRIEFDKNKWSYPTPKMLSEESE